jgi:hypothetical protein
VARARAPIAPLRDLQEEPRALRLDVLPLVLNPVLDDIRAVADRAEMAVYPPDQAEAAVPHLARDRPLGYGWPWSRVCRRAEQ